MRWNLPKEAEDVIGHAGPVSAICADCPEGTLAPLSECVPLNVPAQKRSRSSPKQGARRTASDSVSGQGPPYTAGD